MDTFKTFHFTLFSLYSLNLHRLVIWKFGDSVQRCDVFKIVTLRTFAAMKKVLTSMIRNRREKRKEARGRGSSKLSLLPKHLSTLS